MPRRQIAQRQVTDVALPQDGVSDQMADLGDKMMDFSRKQDLAKMNDFQADANLQMLDVTNKWRVANEQDPTNREATNKLHAEYDRILNQYNDKVGIFSKGDWLKVSQRLKYQYQADNAQWGQKQGVVNMESSINGSIKKNQKMMESKGISFADGGGSESDLLSASGFSHNQRDLLSSFGMSTLGKAATDKLLEDTNSDNMFSFIYGVSKKNPQMALELLKREDVQNDLGPAEKVNKARTMIEGIKKTYDEGQEQAIIDNRYLTMSDIALGKSDLVDIVGKINNYASKDSDLAEAMQSVADSGGKYVASDADNESFQNLVNKVYSAGSQKEISDFLVGALKEKKVSRDRLAIIVNAASQRGKTLPTLSDSEKMSDDPRQQAIAAGLKSLNDVSKRMGTGDGQMYADYLGKTSQGVAPKEAFDFALKNSIIRQFPQAATMETPPTMIFHPASEVRVVFPRNQKGVWANRIYNQQAGRFELNPETHPNGKK